MAEAWCCAEPYVSSAFSMRESKAIPVLMASHFFVIVLEAFAGIQSRSGRA
jgi:hypothetical protein